ncbi:MAG: general secretion pathway protein GspK [Candidatus Anammoximicrobium sp.]|nr:general secretion pathway protein GspK [Candidatus Anammoximicrobium sp.]
MVLVIVLVVVAVLALAAYAFQNVMLAENEVTQMAGRQIQAYSLAASGVAHVQAFLMQDAASQADAGGLYDNSPQFQAVTVVQEEEETDLGRFTVVAPALDEEGYSSGVRYGLEDESARINLNALTQLEKDVTALSEVAGSAAAQAAAAGAAASGETESEESGEVSDQETAARDLLMVLPGMTEDVADAILDWLDADNEPREFGAEAEYYSGLSSAYAPRNGQLQTVEELLLVRGVTPQLLFGADVNRNGTIDTGEIDQAGAATGTDAETLSTGWASRLTLYSRENNVTAEGLSRINLNEDDLRTLFDSLTEVLPEEQAIFIVAYRQNGEYTGSETGEAYSSGELDLSQASKTKFSQVLDLVGKKVQVKFKDAEQETILQSPFGEDLVSMSEYMPTLMDQVTIVTDPVIHGRININQAPREILLGIPGMTEEIVEQIVGQRTPDPGADPACGHETWLLTQGLVTLDEMRSLMPFVCAGGDAYRAQIIGYYDDGGAASRLEVVLDATQQPPRVLLWRDISHLGRGYALDTLGVTMRDEG